MQTSQLIMWKVLETLLSSSWLLSVLLPCALCTLPLHCLLWVSTRASTKPHCTNGCLEPSLMGITSAHALPREGCMAHLAAWPGCLAHCPFPLAAKLQAVGSSPLPCRQRWPATTLPQYQRECLSETQSCGCKYKTGLGIILCCLPRWCDPGRTGLQKSKCACVCVHMCAYVSDSMNHKKPTGLSLKWIFSSLEESTLQKTEQACGWLVFAEVGIF